MKRLLKAILPMAAGILLFQPFAEAQQADAGTRSITFLVDDAQSRYTSKVFELKHVAADDIIPYINAAVSRFSARSSVKRITSSDPKAKGAILVSTGPKCIPLVADLIAKIDKPGRANEFGSLIDGTGITRISYSPKYRAAEDMVMLVRDVFGSPECNAYLDKGSNTIYWKDEHHSAVATLAWIEFLDRPLPQAEIRLTYYEFRESNLRDIGFDYLAWKNGPGVNLLNVGYSAGRVALDEQFISSLLSNAAGSATEILSNFTSAWGYGGFFTAPQFDLSFIRLLQQSGNATVAGHASLIVTGTPVQVGVPMAALKASGNYTYKTDIYPQYQNIQKSGEGRTWIGYPNNEAMWADSTSPFPMDPNAKPMAKFAVYAPVICFASSTGENLTPADKGKTFYAGKDGNVIFTYDASFSNVVERGDTGNELGHSVTIQGSTTLGFNQEKVLAVYEKETDVEQTLGLPFFSRIPILKYLFSTETTIKERTYVVVTAEANLINIDSPDAIKIKRDTHELDVSDEVKGSIF
ncbi:MAG: hypothetical protein IKM17_04515 [Lentisphaeria bacterium]|nr:hypothetical protein [Lentisphaeria bacterium]